jgi:hypothetical protein
VLRVQMEAKKAKDEEEKRRMREQEMKEEIKRPLERIEPYRVPGVQKGIEQILG